MVMTNSPPFDEQLALDAYWREIGGLPMPPGTNRAADRFVRETFYVKSPPQTADSQRAVAQVFSVIRGVSVPLGFTVPDKPNIASTVWRTAYDQKNRLLYFDSATSPSVFWLKIGDLAIAPGSPVQRLPLADAQTYGGDVKAGLQSAKPFAFLPASGMRNVMPLPNAFFGRQPEERGPPPTASDRRPARGHRPRNRI